MKYQGIVSAFADWQEREVIEIRIEAEEMLEQAKDLLRKRAVDIGVTDTVTAHALLALAECVTCDVEHVIKHGAARALVRVNVGDKVHAGRSVAYGDERLLAELAGVELKRVSPHSNDDHDVWLELDGIGVSPSLRDRCYLLRKRRENVGMLARRQ